MEHQRAWGFGDGDLALLGADEARERLAATDILGATYTPHCATIHPARLVRSLAHHVVVMGGRIHEATPATAIEPGVVRTTRGDVRAPIVVRATEGYTRTLRGERRAIAPVYSLMLATAPLDDGTWDAIGLAHRETFSDHRHLIVYGQRTADGRIAFGGRGAPYHLGSTIRPEYDRNTRVHAALRAALVELLPALRDVPITHAWGGPLGIARDWWASCGLDRSTGLAWAGGYVGDGVTTTNLAGRTLADLIAGRRTDLTALPWVDHRSPRWEPEPLRWIGANLALQVVAAADASERRTGRTSRVMPLFDRVMGR